MSQRFVSRLSGTSDEELRAGGPFYVILYLVMAAAYGIVVATDESMRQPGPLALFTVLMAIHVKPWQGDVLPFLYFGVGPVALAWAFGWVVAGYRGKTR